MLLGGLQDIYIVVCFSPAAALVVDLQVGALDDSLNVSGQIFALQVHRKWLSGKETGTL